ncbi:MAG: TonB-dependent receptor [Bacteroidetes bacterium]|nr:MAG: TonB-dependent receptor [Bacteroidota bacterium]
MSVRNIISYCRLLRFLVTALIATACFSPGVAVGQINTGQAVKTGRLEGRVVHSDLSPFKGVNILIEGTRFGDVSDEKGRFVISDIRPGTYKLRVSAVGYQSHYTTFTIISAETTTIAVTLYETTIQSEEIIVTASRKEERLLTVAQSVSVVDAQELENRNSIQLDDVLRYVPGVHIQENQVNIRGSSGFAFNTGSRVLMLLDGMPFLTPDTDGVPFDILPFSQIERIEVLKGAGSAMYGSGSLGGTIQVITSGFPDTPQTHIRLHAMAYEPVRYSEWSDKWDAGEDVRFRTGVSFAHARRVSPKFGYWVDLAFRTDQGYLNYNTERVFVGFGKIGWTPSPSVRIDVLLGLLDRKKDSFLFWNGQDDVLNPGSLSIGGSAGPAPDAPPSGTNDVVNNQIILFPSLTHVISESFFYSVKGRVYGLGIRPINNETGDVESFEDGTVGVRAGAETQFNYLPSSMRSFTAGFSYDALVAESEFFESSTGSRSGKQPEFASFIQMEESSIQNIRITGGLRFDAYRVDNARTESQVSPRVSVSWSARDFLVLRASFGHGFRVPSIAERYTNNRDFFPIVRNVDLRPETSRSFETGIRLSRVLDGGHQVYTDLAFFHTAYADLIEPRLIPSLQAFQFVNLTSATISGLESTISWDFPGNAASFSVGYTFIDSEDDETGLPLPFRSQHLVVASASIAVLRSISVGMDARFASEPEEVDSDFALFVPDADQINTTKIVDFRLTYSRRAATVRLHIKNAFDYYYVERAAYFGMPRHFEIQVDLRF